MLIVWLFFNGFGSGRLLGLSWDLLGPSCGPLGGSWRLLGSLLGLAWATWAPLGASWGLLGSLLGPSCWLLGVSRRSLASLWESLVPLGNLLACFLLRGKLLRANYKGGKGLSCCRVGPDDLSSFYKFFLASYCILHSTHSELLFSLWQVYIYSMPSSHSQ